MMIAFTATLLATASALSPEIAARPPRAGDLYEISRDVERSETTDDVDSGSSSDRDVITERIVAVRQDGMELEYNLPGQATADDRASVWQLPVRIFRPLHGVPRLLNGPELEARVDGWLKKFRMTRQACGHWTFSWTGYRIECDPQSAVEMVKGFELGPDDLHDGVPYRDENAIAPVPLKLQGSEPAGLVLQAQAAVDAEAVRRDRAGLDVSVAEVSGKKLDKDAAFQAHAKETISGTISTTLELDAAGWIRRRTTVTRLTIARADGKTENKIATLTLERRLVAPFKP